MKYLILLSLFIFSSAFCAEVDLKKSSFTWHGTKITGKHLGVVKLKKANIQLKDKKIMRGEFIIDLSTISISDLEGKWKTKFEKHIKSADFFDIGKYPTAKLVINKADDKNIYGNLSIKDKTGPITIPYTKKGSEFSGTMKFDRTKFNMIYGSGNFFKNLGDKVIHDEVRVEFKVYVK